MAKFEKWKKSSPVNDISEAVRWDGVGSWICLFHIQAENNYLNFVFEDKKIYNTVFYGKENGVGCKN